MNASGIHLGRILGIPVRLDWTLLVVAGLLAFSLGVGRFPLDHPGYPGLAYLLVGALAAALFFASVLAHELAHAVVARRNGTPVRGITLWFLGGLAELGGEPRSPGAEFRIAVAGPATSVAAATLFGSVAMVGDVLGIPSLLGSALAWLAVVNIVLPAFNLLPGAPLDGGRVLSAALWARGGDRYRALEAAARAGTVVGAALIGLGVIQLLTGAGGLWTALIGWFVIAAARAEGETARLRRLREEAAIPSAR